MLYFLDSFPLGAANPVMAFQISYTCHMISFCFGLHHHPLSVLYVVFCQPVLHCSVLSLPVIEGSVFCKTVKLIRKCLIYCWLPAFPSINSTRGTAAELKEWWVLWVALNTCVVHPQREATRRSIYHCGGVRRRRKSPPCRLPRWSSSRISSATFLCSRGGRRRTSWSVSDRDGECRRRVSSLSGGCGVGAAVMCNVCVCVLAQATNTTGLSSMSAQVDSKSNKAVPCFSGCFPRALNMVITPPTQGRSVTCLSPAVSNWLL